MRISDWSSDVCSSDLLRNGRNREAMVLAVRDSWLAVPGCCAAQRLNQANPRSGLSLNELSALAHWRELSIGRASSRERVCQYVSISVVAVSLKKKKIHQTKPIEVLHKRRNNKN